MVPRIRLTREQQARLKERPTICVFCGQSIKTADLRNDDVMMHKVPNGARLCHKTCVAYIGLQSRLFSRDDELSV